MARDDGRNVDQRSDGPAGEDLTETLMSALKHKEILVPAALSAAGAVAATKGPDLMRRLSEGFGERGEGEFAKLGGKAVEAAMRGLGGAGGNAGEIAGKALSKAVGGAGGDGGGKKTRRLPIQRWTDVAVPVETAYEAWTKFEDFPRFMRRVLSVETKESKGKAKVSWQEKIWFSRRQWEGEITDRRKNDRIAWKTTSGMSHKGIVSFHRLDERLTRVMVEMEFEPTGMLEKMASGLRFVKRAVQSDLARFKAYVEMQDAKGIDYRPNPEGEQRRGKDEGDKKSRGSRSSGGGARGGKRRERAGSR